MLKEARYYEPLDELKVRCQLCPHSCILQPGKLGKCQVKRNVGGKLIAVNYGLISAMHLDPIEKKTIVPLSSRCQSTIYRQRGLQLKM